MKKILLVALTGIVALLFSSSLALAQEILPNPSLSETLHDIHCINGNTCFMAGDNGVVMKLTNGRDLQLLPSNITSNLSGVFFINEQKGFVVGGSGSILRTFDGGRSWTSTNTAALSFLSIDFANENLGLAVGNGGRIFRTTDGGDTWIDVSPRNVSNNLLRVKFASTSVAYAVGGGGIILKSTDRGSTWVLSSNEQSAGFYEVDTLTQDRVFAAGLGSKILKTANGGDSWDAVELMPTLNIRALHFCDTVNGWAAADSSGGFWKTTDGGNTWAQILFNPSRVVRAQSFADGVGYFVGDRGTVIKIANACPFSNNTTIAVQPPETEAVVEGQLSENWTAVSTDIVHDIVSVSFANPSIGYLLTDPGKIYRTGNRGKTWLEIFSEEGGSFTDLHFVTPEKGWKISVDGKIEKTIDGGYTWRKIKTEGLAPYTITGTYFFNPRKAFVAGIRGNEFGKQQGALLLSKDGGRKWFPHEISTSEDLHDIQWKNIHLGYAVGSNGTLLQTLRGGKLWRQIPTGVSNTLRSVFFLTPKIGILTGDEFVENEGKARGLVLLTRDGGKTWKQGINSSYLRAATLVKIKGGFRAILVGEGGLIARKDFR